MGHEVSVNAVQMATAFSVFANGGYLVEPRLLRGVLSSDGTMVEDNREAIVKRRVINAETASVMMTKVLRGVVTEGTGRLADLEDYAVGGKTGTAQKLDGGVYSHSKYISSFICAAPVQEPRAVVLIVVDEPASGPARFGGTVAAPYCAETLKSTLDYMLIDVRRRQYELLYAQSASSGGAGDAR
jgi:cell division protein FtsI/penicillin-binding protein 2